jgi:hypothetical protein
VRIDIYREFAPEAARIDGYFVPFFVAFFAFLPAVVLASD